MRFFKTILFLSITVCLYGQSDKIVVYGKVISPKIIFEPFSYCGITYKEYKPDGNWTSACILVDKFGNFSHSFLKNSKLVLSTFYDNFYRSDTTLNLSIEDSLKINFTIYPKEFKYTEKSAQVDISNGLVQLIIFDSLIYCWNQKINFSKEFGFNYLLLPEPEDNDFIDSIDSYNIQVEEHLTAINDSTWYNKINIIIDSLIHLDADNYGKENIIYINELTFPKINKLPSLMTEKIQEQKSEFERLFGKNKIEYANYTSDYILDKIDNDSNYQYLFVAEYWIAFNYEKMIPELIKRIINKKEVGLGNTADLIIWERIQSGDLNFYGHGGVSSDDLFTVAGRANRLLREITGEDFGSVSMYSTEKDLKKLQNRWAYWIINLKKE